MQTSDFDYELPEELIATHPAARRDESRLMVLDRSSREISHRVFRDLIDYINPGDLLVLNDSRVMKARLRGHRAQSGGSVEALLLHPESADQTSATRWLALCRPAKKLKPGEQLIFADGALAATVISVGAEGERILEFATDDIMPWLEKHGEIPLPPYIVQRRKTLNDSDDSEDLERYQTVYSRQQGSVAAPTAGLHFTPDLLKAVQDKGAGIAYVTLHVGPGTFKPVDVEDPTAHPMHSENYEVPETTARRIQETKAAGGRVIAVGTTTVRTLESAWDDAANCFFSGPRSTRLLILPGYKYKVVDGLVTNFHLPRSTLLMMVSALADPELIMQAYQAAISEKYRFYSYGDAMLIV